MPDDAGARFEALTACADPHIDLAAAALAMAAARHGQVDEAACTALLDGAAASLRERLQRGEPAARALGDVVHGELGLRGNRDDYYDPANSDLDRVLQRRLGIPITLALVMLEVGWRAGLDVAPVSFPVHFLVRLVDGGNAHYLDPFNPGETLDEAVLVAQLERLTGSESEARAALPAALEPCDRREVLARMLRNLLAILARDSDPGPALTVADLAVRLQPASAAARRNRGALYLRVGHQAGARDDLQAYLRMAPGAADAAQVRAALDGLDDAPPPA